MAAVTVRVVLAVIDPTVIVIVVEPGAAAVATPVAGTMLATAGLLECHVPAIGAGVGAGAGTGVAAATGKQNVAFSAETPLAFTVTGVK